MQLKPTMKIVSNVIEVLSRITLRLIEKGILNSLRKRFNWKSFLKYLHRLQIFGSIFLRFLYGYTCKVCFLILEIVFLRMSPID